MNSKWNAQKQKVIEIAIGSEAAAMLKFGSSPFVLQEGQTTLPEKKKPKITSSNLNPDQKGSIDVDDLNSVSGQSNADNVFQNRVSDDDAMDEDTDDDDDDVSTKVGIDDDVSMDEDEEESAGDEESTKSGWRKKASGSDSASDESGDEVPSDSESTKADLEGLKNRGRKVRGETAEGDRWVLYCANSARRRKHLRRCISSRWSR